MIYRHMKYSGASFWLCYQTFVNRKLLGRVLESARSVYRHMHTPAHSHAFSACLVIRVGGTDVLLGHRVTFTWASPLPGSDLESEQLPR